MCNADAVSWATISAWIDSVGKFTFPCSHASSGQRETALRSEWPAPEFRDTAIAFVRSGWGQPRLWESSRRSARQLGCARGPSASGSAFAGRAGNLGQGPTALGDTYVTRKRVIRWNKRFLRTRSRNTRGRGSSLKLQQEMVVFNASCTRDGGTSDPPQLVRDAPVEMPGRSLLP